MRATVVTGMPSWTVRSSDWSLAAWARNVLRLRRPFGIVTSILYEALADAPVRGGRAVAEHRIGAVGEDGRHSVALSAEVPMADGVHAPVDAMEAPDVHAVLDGAPTQP